MQPTKKEEITYRFELKEGHIVVFKIDGKFKLVGLVGINNLLDAGLSEVAAALIDADKFIKENE